MIRTTRAAAAVALVAAAALVVYGPILVGLTRQWASDDNYSHGFIVVPFAAWLAWRERARLAATPRNPRSAGFIVVLVGLLLLVAGQLGAELFLTRISMIVVLAGGVLFLFGPAHLRRLAFPVAFLVLMIPLPAIVFNQIALPLQLFASRAGEAVLSMAGVPVLREGNVLVVPSITLEVAQACSGIRSLISLFTLAVLLGKLSTQPRAARVALALMSVPIAIVANAARVAGTGLAAEWISPRAAQGFFHEFSGWVVFVIAVGLLVLTEKALASARGWRIPLPRRTVEAA